MGLDAFMQDPWRYRGGALRAEDASRRLTQRLVESSLIEALVMLFSVLVFHHRHNGRRSEGAFSLAALVLNVQGRPRLPQLPWVLLVQAHKAALLLVSIVICPFKRLVYLRYECAVFKLIILYLTLEIFNLLFVKAAFVYEGFGVGFLALSRPRFLNVRSHS